MDLIRRFVAIPSFRDQKNDQSMFDRLTVSLFIVVVKPC